MNMFEPPAIDGTTLEVSLHRIVGTFELQVEFVAEPGITVLFGHSGSGKSMTLRCIAGLARPDSGRITLGSDVIFDSERHINLPAHRRGLGMVLQNLALFPHLSVKSNIEFGLVGVPDGLRRARTRDMLSLLNLAGFEKRKPRSLSGGQQQRVALARALALENRLLLLDEPFSALDDSLRTSMRKELLRLRAELGLTILFVTHDLREAHFLADRVAVFDNGRILQLDTREAIFKRPNSRRVAQLTGVPNIWRGVVTAVEQGSLQVLVDGLPLRSSANAAGLACGQAVDVIVRAERINLRRDLSGAPGGSNNLVTVELVSQYAYGSTHTLHLKPAGAGPLMEVEIAARPYEVVGVATRKLFDAEIDPADVHVVAAKGD